MHAIDAINRFGGDLLAWGLWMNVWTAALLAAAVVLDRLLARRLAPGWRLAIYGVIVVRLLLPIDWASPFGVIAPLGDDGARADAPAWWLNDPLAAVTDAPAGVIADAAAPGAAGDRSDPTRLTWAGGFVLVWIGAAGGLLMVWGLLRRRLALALREATPARAGIRELASRTEIAEDDAIGPAVAGLLRPRIVLPRRLLDSDEISRRELGWIIRHEEAHIARLDHWLVAAMQLLIIVCWPVAALWLAGARVRRLLEERCDDDALRGAAPSERRHYGETLLRLADRSLERRFPMALSNIGLLGHAHSALRSRLRALSRGGSRRWPRFAQVALASLAVIALAGATGRTGAPPAPLDGADAPPEEMIDITVTVFDEWPDHPALVFDVAQTFLHEDDENEPSDDDPDAEQRTHRMTAAEYREYLKRVDEGPEGHILTSPRLLVRDGQSVEVRIGADAEVAAQDEDGGGMRLEVLPTLHDDGTLTLEVEYEAWGLDVRPPAADFENGDRIRRDATATLRPGDVQFILVTGLIGAPTHLVAISARVVGDDPPAPDERQALLEQMTFPQIEYLATVWDFERKPALDEFFESDPIRAGVLAEDARTYDKRVTYAYRVSADDRERIGAWLSARSDRTSLANKRGAAMATPGAWASVRAARNRSGERAAHPFELRFLGRIDDADERKTIDAAVVYEALAFKDQPAGETGANFAIPAGRRVVGDFAFAPGSAVVLLVPPASGSPWRVVMVRAGILASADHYPFQTLEEGVTEVREGDDPLPGLQPARGTSDDHRER